VTPIAFNLPSTILIGAGASRALPAQLERLGVQRALIVTDAFFASNGLADAFVALLRQHGCAGSIFADVQPDPTDHNVRDGLRAYRESSAQAVIGLGGGSAIDAAKAIAMLATNPEPLRQYMGYHKVAQAGAPMIAIPTTAGTGSEVSRVAVITDTEQHEKMMMLSEHLMPTAALVDYELSMSMPKALTAHVGVDTLTHGIEAYVSRKANGLTDPIALSCIALTATHLLTAWRKPDNRAAREAMALAACQGGMAFSNSSVCLVHGMSRPLGALYHVPHGLSNAVLLPTVTRFSLAGALVRYATIARIVGLAGGADDDETAAHGIEAYVSRKANGLTDPIALSCIALTATHLLTAWRKPDNRAAREAMALAACQGGMAFSNSSVCLVHGMSRPLGALYHVPHGLSNAVLLPTVTRFSLAGALVRYATIARIVGLAGGADDDETAAHKLADGLEALNEALQIPPLRECVRVGRAKFEGSLEKMALDALASGSPQNNPVEPTAEQIIELYKQAW